MPGSSSLPGSAITEAVTVHSVLTTAVRGNASWRISPQAAAGMRAPVALEADRRVEQHLPVRHGRAERPQQGG